MKNFKILFSILISVLLLVSCQEKDPELGPLPDKSTIKFSVSQDLGIDAGGNTVIMKNLTSGIVPMWDYGTGRSNNEVDTIHIAFKGEYIIRFSALTSAGIVECDSVVITVTDDNLAYVNDPLWALLTGGIGQSKTWILDKGKYGYNNGPLYYGDPSRDQVWGNFKWNWDPAVPPGDVTDADFQAEMTFKLIGGPFMTTKKPNETTGDESGTFYLDAPNHTLTTNLATIIRLPGFIANVSNWNSNLRILELTENFMRIAVYRTNSEGPWWYFFNYVSKDYATSYVPKFVPDPNFNLGNQTDWLAGSSATTWKFETNTPFNWTDLNGVYLNEWNAITDYPGWTGYDPAAIAGLENVRLLFYKTGDVEIINNDGSKARGGFSVNEAKNLITFEGIQPNIYISGGWVYASTTSYKEDDGGNVITGENQWKIVRRKTIGGVTTEVWFGKRNTSSKEYMVYHFILASGIPDVKTEMIRGLCGKVTGTSSRTFKIDLNWPVDWTNLKGEGGWTVAGTQDGWYWNADIAKSVKSQTLTFSQTNGIVTVTKKDAVGNITTSPVSIDGATRKVTISNTDIIKIGAGSWLPTNGPDYYIVKGDFNVGPTNGIWIGVINPNNSSEVVSYRYILK